MILVCYDGSDDARAAIEHGGSLFAGQSATVLTVWQPAGLMGTRAASALTFYPSLLDVEELDAAGAAYALQQAEAGAALARKTGLDAEPLSCAETSTTAQAILDEAARVNATAILMGSRGRSGLKSLLLGSISHAVVQHADRPVIVVPSAEVALSRSDSRKRAHHKHKIGTRSQ